jgi:hypothetical protein
MRGAGDGRCSNPFSPLGLLASRFPSRAAWRVCLMSGQKKSTPVASRNRKRSRGRPVLFNAKLAEKICETMAAAGETLTAICQQPGMPSRRTVARWLHTNPDFCLAYARARELLADSFADEVIAIADDGDADVNHARLQVDSRKWYAGKLYPKRYGDRISQELTGAGGGPIRTATVRLPPRPPAEVSKAVAALMKTALKRLGLKAKGRGKASAMEQILASGEPLPPELYAALHAGGSDGG